MKVGRLWAGQRLLRSLPVTVHRQDQGLVLESSSLGEASPDVIDTSSPCIMWEVDNFPLSHFCLLNASFILQRCSICILVSIRDSGNDVTDGVMQVQASDGAPRWGDRGCRGCWLELDFVSFAGRLCTTTQASGLIRFFFLVPFRFCNVFLS